MVTRLVGSFRAWKPSRLVRKTIVIVARLVAIASFLTAISLASYWQRESECFAAGGKLRGLVTCLPTLDHCELGSERIAIGTVLLSTPAHTYRTPSGAHIGVANYCCECTQDGFRCSSSRCLRLPIENVPPKHLGAW